MLSLIISQFGHIELTQRLIGDLREHETSSFELIVVDDGSPLDDPFPWSPQHNEKRLRLSHVGVTSAWNRGAEVATGDVLLFLNNDVHVNGPFVNRLLSRFDDYVPKLVGSKLREERAVPKNIAPTLPRQLLEGWFLSIRKRDFLALNGFDESMRLYFSDTDLQWRFLRTFPNGQLVVEQNLPLVHQGHATTRTCSDRSPIWKEDRTRFVQKWG